MKKQVRYLLMLLLMFLPNAWAVEAGWYEAEVPVSTQTESEREDAVKTAFKQVIMKISGHPEIENQKVIKAEINKAAYFVQDYTYQQPDADSFSHVIHVRFNPRDIDQLIKKANLPTWGQNRPVILVWLTVAHEKTAVPADIIDNNTADSVADAIRLQSKNYGLPFIFPVMDVDDMSKVTPDAVSTYQLPVLKEAANRYNPDGVLVGNVTQTPTELKSEWQLVVGEKQWHWNIINKTEDGLTKALLNAIFQSLATRPVEVKKPVELPLVWLTLEVSNITERHDLMTLMDYLKQLTTVQQVQLTQVSGDIVSLTVQVRGSLASFQQNAGTNHRLVLKEQNDEEHKLIYEWTH